MIVSRMDKNPAPFPQAGVIYLHIPSGTLIYYRSDGYKGVQIVGPSPAAFGAEWTFANALPANYTPYVGVVTLENE